LVTPSPTGEVIFVTVWQFAKKMFYKESKEVFATVALSVAYPW
jgi:hypothetical protein